MEAQVPLVRAGVMMTNPDYNSGHTVVTSPIEDTLPEENQGLKKECDKIKKLFEDFPNLASELQALKGQTTLNEERGKFVIKGATVLQNADIGTNGSVAISTILGNPYLFLAHTHNSPATSTYSVFSWDDLEGIYLLLKAGKIETSQFTSFLYTADGTGYAITISDLNKFRRFFATVDDTEYFNMETAKKRDKVWRKHYFNKENPVFKTDTNENLKDQKAFLDLINDNNMGITLFEADASLPKAFKKLTHNKSTGNVDKENCN